MAPTFALVSALLISQVAVVSAAEAPAFAAVLPWQSCAANAGGCTCSATGLMDNTSVAASNCSKGTTATSNNCFTPCCGDLAAPTCHSAAIANGAFCGAGKVIDYDKLLTTAGDTTALKITNCCKVAPTATCAQVTCNLGGDEAELMKARAGQDAIVCTSNDDCATKCCEMDATMCGSLTSSAAMTKCGVNHSRRAMTSRDDTSCVWGATAAYTATFTNATYISTCCVAKATCSATHTCPTNFVARSPMPTTKCSGATCDNLDCCQLAPNVTQCGPTQCDVGGSHEYVPQGPVGVCGDTPTIIATCTSSKCTDANTVIDQVKLIANGVNGNNIANATVKTSCCITKPVAPAPGVPAVCSAYFAAAAAAAKGTAAGACFQGASMPIMLAVATLFAMKL